MSNMQPPFLEQEMRVTKRDGTFQDIQFDKILTRVKKIGQQANVSIYFGFCFFVCLNNENIYIYYSYFKI